MKATDLMIEDWVIRRGHPEEKMQVLSIGQQERALIELDLDGLLIKEFIDRIEPIPLTPEILEKNGFVQQNKWWYWPKYGTTNGNENVAIRFDHIVEGRVIETIKGDECCILYKNFFT